MKVIVFGATGSVGRLAVETMLEAGHEVTAFARRPHRLGLDHPALTLAQGDAMDRDAVRRAIAGREAAVITIGAGAARRSTIRSGGTMNVIRAMHATGVRRLICQSTLGAQESWDNLDFFWKYIMFGVLLRPVFRDHELQEKLVQASGLDWTIVRPGAFTDGPATGRFREGFASDDRHLRLNISRADIAGFLTRQLQDARYLCRAVAISN